MYRASDRADAALRKLAQRVHERRGRLTVLALALEEPASRCCDIRSVMWNGYQRGFAREHLARARRAVPDAVNAEFAVLAHRGRRAAEALLQDAERRGVDEVVLADASTSGLTRRERRRLVGAWMA